MANDMVVVLFMGFAQIFCLISDCFLGFFFFLGMIVYVHLIGFFLKV